MVDQLTMRASDRDRQQVVDRLRSALEDGRLTMDEYVGRMEAAYKAATYGDLVPLCADLPASPPVIGGPRANAGAAAVMSNARMKAMNRFMIFSLVSLDLPTIERLRPMYTSGCTARRCHSSAGRNGRSRASHTRRPHCSKSLR